MSENGYDAPIKEILVPPGIAPNDGLGIVLLHSGEIEPYTKCCHQAIRYTTSTGTLTGGIREWRCAKCRRAAKINDPIPLSCIYLMSDVLMDHKSFERWVAEWMGVNREDVEVTI